MRAVLTDIEGTTTSLSLVRDVLFPYARARLASFIAGHRGEAALEAVLDEVREIEGLRELDAAGTVRVLERWMDEDRKITPLKTLQGMIWRAGYVSGELRGHVYDDAAERLRAWHERGIALYVYSSGSVAAQKLLFGHSTAGDLTPLFSGYFDTTTGGKLEARSYERIALAIALPPSDVLFLSDSVAELDAARQAGLATVWIDREGTASGAEARGHRHAQSFVYVCD
jgi:enolase-phosphatase E1